MDCEGNVTFGVCIPSFTCQYVMMIPPEHRCEFALVGDDCSDEDALIKYMPFLTCTFHDFPPYDIYVGLACFVLLIVFYFLILSVVSDYFTPSLCYISNVLGLSEPLAGATLLALGNSSPDLITCMVGAVKIGVEQIISQVLGGGMFLTTVVVATIALIRPFETLPVTFYRNLITYLVAIILLRIAYEDGKIYLGEAFVFLVLYAVYLALFFIHAKRSRNKAKQLVDTVVKHDEAHMEAHDVVLVVNTPDALSMASDGEARGTPGGGGGGGAGGGGGGTGTGVRFGGARVSTFSLPSPPRLSWTSDASPILRRQTTNTAAPQVDMLHRRLRTSVARSAAANLSMRAGVEMPPPLMPRMTRTTSIIGLPNAALQVERAKALRVVGAESATRTETLLHGQVMGVMEDGTPVILKSTNIWRDFLNHMNPFNASEWKESNYFMRVISVILIPLVVVCKLLIPCIDESIVCNNWCKLLVVLQCLYLPPATCVLCGILGTSPVIYLPVLGALTFMGLASAVIVALTSEVDQAPRYHILCAIVGFLTAMLAVYYVANEVVSLLQTFGQVLGISIVTLSMTILPWGNSIGDLMNAITLSKAGYPRMAYTAIYGSNMLMVLVGVGFSFLLMVTGKGSGFMYYESQSQYGSISDLYFFLEVGCIASLLIVPIFNYELRSAYGVFMLVLYFMFFTFCYLTEFSVIHPLAI